MPTYDLKAATEKERARALAEADALFNKDAPRLPLGMLQLPEGRIDRLQMLRDETEKQMLTLTLQGKGQAANALMITLEKHERRLQQAIDEAAREAEVDDPEAHKAAVVAYVRELAADDPLRVELATLLCGGAK